MGCDAVVTASLIGCRGVGGCAATHAGKYQGWSVNRISQVARASLARGQLATRPVRRLLRQSQCLFKKQLGQSLLLKAGIEL
jgi:hypothetical protein